MLKKGLFVIEPFVTMGSFDYDCTHFIWILLSYDHAYEFFF